MSIVTSRRQSVPRTLPAESGQSWQQAMRHAVREPAELCRLLKLPGELAAQAARAMGDFPLFVPRGYLSRMRPGDPTDPLLRQVLPTTAETEPAAGFTADPVGDTAATASPGLLHKYQGRVLLVTTGACAVHCRYCFRRHYPYSQSPKAAADWQPALDEIAADPTIHEVILSGGDPWTLADATLGELTRRIAAIEHVVRLRIHTRLPIFIPQRVTAGLLAGLTATRLTPIVVLHANHAAELDDAVAAALARLRAAGVLLLNQAVLLAGVNDTADAQQALAERLIALGVLPYYLHQLDRVSGAAHFEVPPATGRAIIAELRRRLPGYAVARYVHEVAGAEHKENLM